MPVAITNKRINRKRKAVMERPVKAENARVPQKVLRPVNAVETRAWSEAFRNTSIMEYSFVKLNEPCEYPFKCQDPVWVRTRGRKWTFGRVSGKIIRVGPTRYGVKSSRHVKQGLFYHVNFGPKFNVRKYFAPMNGEIKPDSEEIRQLLREAGWISSDSEMSDDSHSDYTE